MNRESTFLLCFLLFVIRRLSSTSNEQREKRTNALYDFLMLCSAVTERRKRSNEKSLIWQHAAANDAGRDDKKNIMPHFQFATTIADG